MHDLQRKEKIRQHIKRKQEILSSIQNNEMPRVLDELPKSSNSATTTTTTMYDQQRKNS